jgi:hypothetical protein
MASLGQSLAFMWLRLRCSVVVFFVYGTQGKRDDAFSLVYGTQGKRDDAFSLVYGTQGKRDDAFSLVWA